MNHPYGYRPQKYDRRVDGEAARLVARIFELHEGGLSCEEITDWLNAEVTKPGSGMHETS